MSNLVPGILSTYFVIAIVLALPVSLVLLAWYRRAVRRGMHERSGAGEPSAAVTPAAATSEASGGPKASGRRLRIRLVSIYAVAALAASAVTTLLCFWSARVPFGAMRAFIMGYAFCWPLAPSLAALLALRRRPALLLFVAYVGAGAAVVAGWSVVSLAVGRDATPLGNLAAYAVFLVMIAAVPFAFILVTGSRKLRPVTPLVLAALLVFSFSSLLVQNGLYSLLDSPRMSDLMLFPHASFFWFMLAALPVGYLCWLVLRGLGRGFEAKGFSDTQLLVDTWWLISAFDNCVFLSSDWQWRGLYALLGFAVYRTTVAAGLALWPIDRGERGRGRLLLLRVFGHQRRTERLFDAIGQRWRLEGSVKMIAGVDLAGRTIDPGDIVTFAAGRLRERFVRDAADLQRRVEAVDERRDPDGRFRVTEFYCHDDTWRPTLESLLLCSDLVLMDLRGFSASNQGCLAELRKLAEHRKLERTLFIVDGGTDVELLRATVARAAAEAGQAAGCGLHLAEAVRQTRRELQRIWTSLRALADAPPLRPEP